MPAQTVKGVFEAAMSLPPESRTILVSRLLDTLDTSADEIERAHMQEARRRVAEIKSGSVKLIPEEVALARVRASLVK